jgi:hypothetical protein
MGCLYYPRKQTSLSHAADCDVIVCYGGAKLADKHLASKIHCIDDRIIEWLQRRERRRRSRQGSREFPELTAIADIKLNEPHSLRLSQKPDTLITPDISRMPSQSRRSNIFSPTPCFKKGFDLMIRYSTYRSTNRRTNPSTPIQLLSSLEEEYRELQDLRERVREAEAAAAKRLRPRVKLKTRCRPVSTVVSRKRVTQNPEQFTKRQLYTMLAEAVRNTG